VSVGIATNGYYCPLGGSFQIGPPPPFCPASPDVENLSPGMGSVMSIEPDMLSVTGLAGPEAPEVIFEDAIQPPSASALVPEPPSVKNEDDC